MPLDGKGQCMCIDTGRKHTGWGGYLVPLLVWNAQGWVTGRLCHSLCAVGEAVGLQVSVCGRYFKSWVGIRYRIRSSLEALALPLPILRLVIVYPCHCQ
jgi:hypothetical protein